MRSTADVAHDALAAGLGTLGGRHQRAGAAGALRVSGLASSVDISNAETTEALAIGGNGGTDTVESTELARAPSD
jgi:hypothetical protein